MRQSTRWRCLLRSLFLLAVAATTLLALLPSPAFPPQFAFSDKLQHGLVFAALAMLGGAAFPRRPGWLAVGLVVHGAAIEMMQGLLTTTRHADPADWLADCAGIAVGLLALFAFRHRYESAPTAPR